MTPGVRTALLASALPYSGWELALDFKSGMYRSQSTVTTDVTQLPGYSFARSGQKYELNAAGVWTPVASGLPAILPGLGYMSRPSIINYLLNTGMADAAVGKFPTGWGVTSRASVVGTGTIAGLPYIDIRLVVDNSAGSGTFYASFDPSGGVTNPTVSANFCSSVFLQLLQINSGVLTPMSLQVRYTNAGSFVTAVSTSIGGGAANGIDSQFRRFVAAGSTSNTTPTRAFQSLEFQVQAGQTTDITFRYAAPQFNGGLFPGPVILNNSTSASAGVGADAMVLSQPLPQDEDWLILTGFNTDHTAASMGANVERFFSINDGTSNNRMHVQRQPSGTINGDAIVGGVSGPLTGNTALSGTGRAVVGLKHQGGKFRVVSGIGDKLTQGTEYTQIVPPLNTFNVGSAGNSAQPSAFIETLMYRRGTFSDDQVALFLKLLGA